MGIGDIINLHKKVNNKYKNITNSIQGIKVNNSTGNAIWDFKSIEGLEDVRRKNRSTIIWETSGCIGYRFKLNGKEYFYSETEYDEYTGPSLNELDGFGERNIGELNKNGYLHIS